MNTNAPEAASPSSQEQEWGSSFHDFLLRDHQESPYMLALLKQHWAEEKSTTQEAFEAAVLVAQSHLSEEQKSNLIPLLLGDVKSETPEQEKAMEHLILEVQSYLNMEDESWGEFMGTGSRRCLERFTKPINARMAENITEILGEPSSSNQITFGVLSHHYADDEGSRHEEFAEPRELCAAYLNLITMGTLDSILTVLSFADLPTMEQGLPVSDFHIKEVRKMVAEGVSVILSSPNQNEEGNDEETAADKEKPNEPTLNVSDEASKEENAPAHSPSAEEHPHPDQENMLLDRFSVNGKDYSVSHWNSIVAQIPQNSVDMVVEFSRSLRRDSDLMKQLVANVNHITWSGFLQVAELANDFSSAEWAMLSTEWSELED